MQLSVTNRFILSVYQSCQSGQVPARRLAGDQAGCQARLTFDILAWPDPSILYLAWPAG